MPSMTIPCVVYKPSFLSNKSSSNWSAFFYYNNWSAFFYCNTRVFESHKKVLSQNV